MAMALVPAVLTLNVSPCSFSVAVDKGALRLQFTRVGPAISDERYASGCSHLVLSDRLRARLPRARPGH